LPQRAANKSRGGMSGSRAGSPPSSAARSNLAMGFSSTKCTQLEVLNSLQMCSEVPGSRCPFLPLPSESCAIRGPPCTYRAGAFRRSRKKRMPTAGVEGLLAPQTPINDSLNNRCLRALRCRSRLLDRCAACEDPATPSGLQLQGGYVLKTDGFRRRRLPSRPAGRGPRNYNNAAL